MACELFLLSSQVIQLRITNGKCKDYNNRPKLTQQSAQSSQGIQSLLQTEKGAQEIVSKARQYRTQKLKAAKLDAKAEIDAYKEQKAAELTKFEEEFAGSNKKAEEEADKDVQVELDSIKKIAASKKSGVVKLLVDAVASPAPKLPENVTKVGA